MTRHFPSNRHVPRRHQQQPQEQQKDKGWYCKEHDTKYLCKICGDDNIRDDNKKSKYYFVDSPITF